MTYIHYHRLLRRRSGKESACQRSRLKRLRFDPRVRKIPWGRKWQPAPVFSPKNLLDRGTWWATVHGIAESDMAEHACTYVCKTAGGKLPHSTGRSAQGSVVMSRGGVGGGVRGKPKRERTYAHTWQGHFYCTAETNTAL